MMRLEIAHADRLRTPGGIDLLQVVPRLLPDVRRPVDQIQIHIIHAQTVEALLERFFAAVRANVVVPQLGGDEQVASRHAGTADSLADRRLVAIYHRRVDMPISVLQRACTAFYRRVAVRRAEHAQTDLRDDRAVVQRDRRLNRHDHCLL